MSLVRLHDLSKTALIALSFASFVAACSSDDTKPDLATERNLTSAPLPPGDDSNNPGAPSSNAPGTGSNPSPSNPSPSNPSPSNPSPSNPSPSAPSPSNGDDAGSPSPPSTPPTPSASNLRGTNLVGMEGDYGFNQTSGPVADSDYAVHSNQIVDYLVTKKVNVIRFLFSWERMQSTLGGSVPASSSGNYKTYYDNYKRIVDYATDKGITVVMEPWQANSSGGAGGARWRGNLVGGGTVTSAHFADFWSKMAKNFASNSHVAIGLVNEPNGMSTMSWFGIAQDAVTAIRSAGFTGDIFVPGNGWTGAGNWTDSGYDTASTKRSNAYGWLNAAGTGKPLSDPLDKSIVEVHSYADSDASGSSTEVDSTTTSRSRVKVVTDWAKTNGLKVWVGEIGMYAKASNASANWNDFVSYLGSSSDTLVGFAWWGCGKPGWWDDVAASGGGHFSITPTNNYSSDTVNMDMIEGAFSQ